MNIHSDKYCSFCNTNSKITSNGFRFCPNGHWIVHIITGVGVKHELVQPTSNGNFEGVDIFRLGSIKGDLCDENGNTI